MMIEKAIDNYSWMKSKETYSFWDEFTYEMRKVSIVELAEITIPVYYKYLSEKELDTFIDGINLPRSKLGLEHKMLLQKLSSISKKFNEEMHDAGIVWGNNKAESLVQKIEQRKSNSIGQSHAKQSISDKHSFREQVYTFVDEMPQFPGGEENMMSYLGENIKYPFVAQQAGIEGLVVVAFDITTMGDIVNSEIIKSLGAGTDEEAIRVVKRMPKWIPGKHKGKVVPVRYTLPIRFSIIE